MASRLFGTKPLPEPADVLSIESIGANFGEILTKIQTFSSANWQPFCYGPNESSH